MNNTANRVIENDELGIYVDGIKIRKTNEVPIRVSVHDLVEVLTGQKDRHVWDRMKTNHEELTKYVSYYKFPGRGQNVTPVIGSHGVVMIVNVLPGRMAQEFRKQSVHTIVRYLGGDLSLINDIIHINGQHINGDDENPLTIFKNSNVQDDNTVKVFGDLMSGVNQLQVADTKDGCIYFATCQGLPHFKVGRWRGTIEALQSRYKVYYGNTLKLLVWQVNDTFKFEELVLTSLSIWSVGGELFDKSYFDASQIIASDLMGESVVV